MRVLIVIEHYYPHVGGVELVFQRLAEGLVKKGCKVTLLTSRLSHTKRNELLNGVTIRRVWVPPFLRRYFFTFFAIPAALSAARHTDVIHTTTYNGAFPAWIAAKVRKKPCIITVLEVIGSGWQQLEISWFSAMLFHFLEQMVLRLTFTHYICISYATRNRLSTLGTPAKKISVIYNGIDTDLFHKNVAPNTALRAICGLREKDFVFLYFGRSGVTKGVAILVRAFHRVVAFDRRARLVVMLSPTPMRHYRRLLKLIYQSPASEHIVKIDPVTRDAVPGVVAECDTVVIPSLTEGFGFAAAEAAAMEKPLVVSRAGSLPEVVSGRVVWVHPGDVDSLARGLIKALKGDFERIPKKEFSWAHMISQTYALYKSLSHKSS